MSQTMPNKFQELIDHHDKPVLVDFWAEWCGPCKVLSPVVQQLAKEWKEKVTVIKVNTEQKPEIAGQYGISGIPTLILFKDGQEVHRESGAMPLEQVKSKFEPFL